MNDAIKDLQERSYEMGNKIIDTMNGCPGHDAITATAALGSVITSMALDNAKEQGRSKEESAVILLKLISEFVLTIGLKEIEHDDG